MGFKINPRQLISRIVRINIVNGTTGSALLNFQASGVVNNSGIRKIEKASAIIKNNQQNDGGLLGWVFNQSKNLVGWLFSSATGFMQWTWTNTWGTVVNTIEKVKSFNWNQTDEQIQQSIKSRNQQLASIWGGVLGSGVGWLTGIAVGSGVAYLCPVIGSASLARLVAGEVTLEAGQDIKSRLQVAIQQTASIAVSDAANVAFINYRHLIKSLPESVLVTLYGESKAKWIKNKWGGKGQPDSSFNAQMEEEIDSITDQNAKAFIENFLEEAWDSFVESGFIVAHQLDEAYQQSRLAQDESLGQERSVEIALDRNAPDDIVTFSGVPQKLLPATIQQTINTHRLIHNRDIGQYVGLPFDDQLYRALPQKRHLELVFRESPTPPYKQSGEGKKFVVVGIPNVKAGVTWKEIKAVCEPYTWGKHVARALLDSRRKMVVYASTKEEAVRRLQLFATLTEDKILNIYTGEEEQKTKKLVKKPTRIYPSYCTFIYRRPSGEGKTLLDGKTYQEKVQRIVLWTKNPPDGKNSLEQW